MSDDIKGPSALMGVLMVEGLRAASEAMREIMACLREAKLEVGNDTMVTSALAGLSISQLYRQSPNLTEAEARVLFTSFWELRSAQKDLWYAAMIEGTGQKGQA